MKKITITIIVLVSLLFTESILFAQLDSLSQDDRIRLTASEYFIQRIDCKFDKIQSDSLFISMHSEKFIIPVQHVQKIELWKGKKRNTFTGALVGVVIGLVLGVTLALVDPQDSDDNGFQFHLDLKTKLLIGSLAGPLIFGSTGALIGTFIQSDRWEEITIHNK